MSKNNKDSIQKMRSPLFILFLFFSFAATAQPDTLLLSNNDLIVGELKSLEKGVATVETDYSKSDFKIEWSGVKKVITSTSYLVTTSEGSRHLGRLYSPRSGFVTIYNQDSIPFGINIDEIVMLASVSKGFWDQLSAAISFGYSLTRAQNLEQLSLRSSIGYKAKRWSGSVSFDAINSTQDDVEPIFRRDGAINFNYFLPKDWYIPATVSYLSNTEQKIDARLLGKLGVGKFLIHRNKAYWGFSTGANYNFEKYLDETSDRKSWEGFIGTELNLFDIGDLSLLTRAVLYPSFTESGRVRADFTFDMKYDLPLDFYINFGTTINFDNQPVANAPRTDYVLQTTLGWKW